MKGLLLIIVVCLCLASCGGGGSSPTPPTSQPPAPPPQPTIESFTLNAPAHGMNSRRVIDALSVGESFEVRFKPLRINGPGNSWGNVIDFFARTDKTLLGLILVWSPDSTWQVHSQSGDEIEATPIRKLISMNGRFHTVRIVRRNEGFSNGSSMTKGF